MGRWTVSERHRREGRVGRRLRRGKMRRGKSVGAGRAAFGARSARSEIASSAVRPRAGAMRRSPASRVHVRGVARAFAFALMRLRGAARERCAVITGDSCEATFLTGATVRRESHAACRHSRKTQPEKRPSPIGGAPTVARSHTTSAHRPRLRPTPERANNAPNSARDGDRHRDANGDRGAEPSAPTPRNRRRCRHRHAQRHPSLVRATRPPAAVGARLRDEALGRRDARLAHGRRVRRRDRRDG